MKQLYLVPLILFCFLFSLPSFGQRLKHVQGEVLVQLKASISAEKWQEQHLSFRGKNTQFSLEKKISQPLNIYAYKFDWTRINENDLLQEIRKDPYVELAQFNHFIKFRNTPDDPQFDDQWQYINTGQSGGSPGADIDADLAWDITTGGITAHGDTIVVCIIDGGYDTDHDDLAPNLWYNYAEIPNNDVDDDNNGFIDDFRGWNTGQSNDNVDQGDAPFHGTAVAGIVGAKGNNGIGVAGINWDVKLMLVSGGTGVESEVIEAYSYPLSFRQKYNETNGEEGAFVVSTNASWGVDGGQPADAPIWCAMYDSLGTQGILNAGATINGNQNVDTFGDLPTACPSDYLLAVTNMDHNDQKVTQAGYGLTTIDLGAFGAGTWTAASGNSYGGFGGTSGATPHVAGTIGLLYAAPCSDFMDYAKTYPDSAALLIRKYILDGVDHNTSLEEITVTEGRLNVNNSIRLLMNNCGPCPAPSGLNISGVTDTLANLSWTSSDSALVDTLIWRHIDSLDWNVVADATSPYQLTGLAGCNSYQFQVYSQCDSISSDSSRIFTFVTDGCCENPVGFNISEITDSTAFANWNSVLAAQSYNVQIKLVDSVDWLISNSVDTTFSLTNLLPCRDYEVQIQTVCEGDTLDFSSPLTFRTKGCGACTDLDYCPAPELDGSEEWIESVEVAGFSNISGSNSSYGDFTASLEGPTLLTNNSFPITLTPGFPGQNYEEQFKIWIDFNQDGDFDDSNEEVFSSNNTSIAVSGNISIPNEALLGLTRMRVSMFYLTAPTPCTAPDFNAFGEVEDYCVTIEEGIAPCLIPGNLDTVAITTTTAELQWDMIEGVTEYTVRYKALAVTDWEELTLDTNYVLIDSLEDCVEYEAQVRSFCTVNDSEFSDSKIFITNCATNTENISSTLVDWKVFPNPFKDQLIISYQLQERQENLTVELLNQLGQVIQSQNLQNILEGSHQLSLNSQQLSSGLYFVRLRTNSGYISSKKVIKTM